VGNAHPTVDDTKNAKCFGFGIAGKKFNNFSNLADRAHIKELHFY
jgi:hypothetical protein